MDPVTLPQVKADYPEFPKQMFKMNRECVLKRVRADKTHCEHSVIMLEGGHDPERYDSDLEPLFRQESNFNYCFGVQEPGYYGLIEIDSGKSVIFAPKLDSSWEIWLGHIPTLEEIKTHHGVDETYYVEDMNNYLDKFNPTVIYTCHGKNTDSGKYCKPAKWGGCEKYRLDDGLLHYHLIEARVHKNEEELKLLRYINKKTSDGHIACMRQCKPGMYEFQLEAIFTNVCYYTGGCRMEAYTSICGSGRNSAILHYGHAGAPNNRIIQDGEWICSDQGNELYGYTSDITCTFPANGTYTPAQKVIYETVLAMNWNVQDTMKPGVNWQDMHTLAYKTMLEKFIENGIAKGSVDEMMKVNLAATFMPHGLGHFMGCDTHDVGGYNKGMPTRRMDAGYRSLRTSRNLEPGMLITCEPGVYFIRCLLDAAYADPVKAKFLNKDVIEDLYFPIGGCRIEDDIVVTETGIEDLSNVPRLIKDVEGFCQGKLLYRKDISNKKHYLGD